MEETTLDKAHLHEENADDDEFLIRKGTVPNGISGGAQFGIRFFLESRKVKFISLACGAQIQKRKVVSAIPNGIGVCIFLQQQCHLQFCHHDTICPRS